MICCSASAITWVHLNTPLSRSLKLSAVSGDCSLQISSLVRHWVHENVKSVEAYAITVAGLERI
jgi:hypothetical protein